MAKTMLALLPLLLLGAACAEPVNLHGGNWDELVVSSGRNAFVKFYAPWCGHCKKLAPDWALLGKEYETSSSVLIGHVDCTADNAKDLCTKFEVRGYPTLSYFADGDTAGQPYNGGRDLDTLKTFVKDTLEVKCNVADLEGCEEKETKFIEKQKGKSAEELTSQLARLTGMLGKSMAPDLKKWVVQRVGILTQLTA